MIEYYYVPDATFLTLWVISLFLCLSFICALVVCLADNHIETNNKIMVPILIASIVLVILIASCCINGANHYRSVLKQRAQANIETLQNVFEDNGYTVYLNSIEDSDLFYTGNPVVIDVPVIENEDNRIIPPGELSYLINEDGSISIYSN